MSAGAIQNSFASGEISPGLYARTDLAKYHVGAALMRNFFVEFGGGASNRPGTAFVGRCKSNYGSPVRLIPFTFSTLQAYALEFGQNYMRVIMNGGYVLEPSFALTGITQANPGIFSATGNNFSVGDWVYFQGVGGMTSLNTRTYIITSITSGNFQLTDLWGNVINTASLPAWTSGGTVARIYTCVTPYAASDLALLKFTQNANIMTLTHNSYAPYNLTRTQHWAWTFTAITYAPTLSAPTGLTATPSSTGTTVYWYQVTTLAADGVTESQPSTYATASSATMSTTACHQTLAWTAATGAAQYNVYRTAEVGGGAPATGQLFGYVGSVVGVGFVDNNITPDFTRTPPQAYNPFSSGNNPGCVTYFQARETFAGTVNQPDGIFMSRPGDYFNMDYSSPSRDNDGIAFNLESQQVNAIKHLIPMFSLIALTTHGAWRIDAGGTTSPITPSSVSAVPQSYNGCSDVPPLVINYDILYVQTKGAKVRDLSYNFYVNLYTGTDISVLSNHLFYGQQIKEWCWAEEPNKLVWAVRTDGELLTLTYLKEQDVMGWAHHDTQGLFMSVCSIPEPPEDAVYFVVARQINGQNVQYVERLASRNFNNSAGIADVTQAFFVDAGVRYQPTYLNATMTPSAMNGTLNISSVAVITGGANYTNPTAYLNDPTGSGATFSVQMSGGVITGLTPLTQGTGYTNPSITISDPTGSGAVVQPVVTNIIAFSTDNAVMLGTVGDVIRINGGIAVITSVNSSTSVNANVTTPLVSLWPAAPSTWSCTAPVSTISGLDHLNGQTVSILADGNVMPQAVVSNGSITIQQPASAIVVGLPYTAQLQSLYIDVMEGGPTIQGKRKKISAVVARVYNTRGLQIGHDFGNTLHAIKERTTQAMGAPIPLNTGDERIIMDPLYDVPGQVCVQQINPLPATVLGLIPEIVIGDN